MSVFKRYIGQDQADSSASTHTSVPETHAPEVSVPAAAPAAASPSAAAAARPSATRNILSSDVEIKGSVKFTNDLVVDGKIEGDIQSSGNLTVGENARIKAEIKTATVVVYGKVHGNIIAADRVDLKSTAEVIGDIKAKTLSVEPGAVFVGKSIVGAAQETVAAPAKQASPAPAQSQPAAAKPATTSEPKQATLPGTQL